jgi:phospho-N-acetylmuramoyl-pentapeptide-transferase
VFYHLLYPLKAHFSPFNVFRYITFRSFFAILTALVLSLIIGPWCIKKLKELQIGQFIREDGPQSHQCKAGTPTMGGLMIICTMLTSTLLWADLRNLYIWLLVIVTLGFGFVGFLDDYLKVIKKHNRGLTGRQKLLGQTLIALVAALWLNFCPP